MRARALALAAHVKWQHATVMLFALMVLLGAANLTWSAHEANVVQAHQAAEQAAQARQGAVVERKLCTTLGRLAALAPPPGSPQANPSRAYLQDLHETLAELSPDLGCRLIPPPKS